MTTLLSPKLTLNYLAYLGYSSSPATDHAAVSALHITRPRKQDRRQKKVARNVFLCYVLGATGSGKTSLLRRFVNKRNPGDGLGTYEPTTKVLSVVNSVEMEGQEKYLVVSLQPHLRISADNDSCKNLEASTNLKLCGIAKTSTERILSSTSMTHQIPTPSPIYRISE